jgi:hypothetical protein
MPKNIKIEWLSEPAEHNYPSAASYLGLLFDKDQVAAYVEALRKAPMSTFKSRDIFRASELPLLGMSNSKVQKNRRKIKAGEAMSPILLVRTGNGDKVIVADGYHRVCSVYGFDQDALIPCKIV